MDWTAILIALIAGAAVGGTVTHLVQWGIDKERQKRAYRAGVIAGARELVHQGQDVDRKTLLVDPRYLAIRPHLAPAVEAQLREQSLTVMSDPYGTAGNVYLAQIRDEADRLEREWDLV